MKEGKSVPTAVQLFEWVMIAAIVTGAGSAALTLLEGDLFEQGARLAIVLLASLAVPLLATLAITREGSRFAFWLLVIVTVADLLPWLPFMGDLSTIARPSVLLLGQFALQTAAVCLLFTPSGRRWLRQRPV